MGEFLSTPVKEKISDDGENSFVSIFYNNILKIAKIRFMLYARLEKKNGRFSYK
jgi:hypothetical protein